MGGESDFFADSLEGGRNCQRVIVEDIGWRQTVQTKKSRKIIFFPRLGRWRRRERSGGEVKKLRWRGSF